MHEPVVSVFIRTAWPLARRARLTSLGPNETPRGQQRAWTQQDPRIGYMQ